SVVTAVLVLCVALILRGVGLSVATAISGEGIRGFQLRRMMAGFRPVSEIYASQGPLSLWVFYPLTALLGPDIVVGRLTVVLSSLVALGAAFVLAHGAGGRPAALAAAATLA